MVKYLTLALALVGSLAVADLAEARHRRGCSSCAVGGGGCPGGVCYAPVAPAKMAADANAPPTVVATSEAPPAVPVATATRPAPRYYATSSNSRRGVFGWRR